MVAVVRVLVITVLINLIEPVVSARTTLAALKLNEFRPAELFTITVFNGMVWPMDPKVIGPVVSMVRFCAPLTLERLISP